ncbi:MAG: mannose-1-phosphate guanylyltransferase/mannose-6-phosphate isomerase [Dehalococcoidia bacterium]|nr:mannose-1-phosphate guanylyltransferase/mannose-6-phosphate isomerase [Dehalococcoidia bacterium]
MNLHPVIFAGGSGTRLWPLSREFYPKPFLSITGPHTMFQETILRLDGMAGMAQPTVVCNEEHRFLVAEQARQIGRMPQSILLEPVGRNTAPALTLAALALEAEAPGGEDPLILGFHADHAIGNVTAFQSAVAVAAELAKDYCIATLGAPPDSPHTGYGYIRKGEELALDLATVNGGAYELAEFIEKPNKAAATRMLDTGEYLWNSGMFFMRTSVWLEEMERFRPDIVRVCREAYENGSEDGIFYRPDPQTFSECPTDTIDYAVMERITAPDYNGHRRAVVVPLDAEWSDLGSWAAIMDISDKDANGNVVRGDTYIQETRDSLIYGQHRLVSVVGLEGVIVVETADAVLVADKNRVEDVKDLVDALKRDERYEQENHRRVQRPWGWYETVDFGPRFQVKQLTVNPGAALSLQMHHHRAEHWVVVSGTAKVTKAGEQFLLHENQAAYVQIGEQHRLENPGTIPLKIIEVQTGSYLGEDDIVRFEDKYNRS